MILITSMARVWAVKGKQSVPMESMLNVWMGPGVWLGHEEKGNGCGAALLNDCLSSPFLIFLFYSLW